MTDYISKHSAHDNTATQTSDALLKERHDEELDLGKPNESIAAVPEGDVEANARSLRVEDIDELPFHPHLPEAGPMRDFAVEAHEDLGLPVSHAWALWLYVTMAHCGHFLFHDDGCIERRLSLNVVLAGDDESSLCRRLAVETLERTGMIDVVTNPSMLQLGESLEAYSSDVRYSVVDTTGDNLFARWHKTVSKQEISLAQLFDADAFNDHLHAEIRASALPPATVPILLSCKLKDILCDRKFPFCIFRNGLIVPSFGCQKLKAPSADNVHALIGTLQQSLIDLPEEGTCLSIGQHAQKALQQRLARPGIREINLTGEGNHAHYRQAGLVTQIIALSAAYAINASLGKGGKPFTGEINKSDMLSAIKAFDYLDRHWNGLDHLYEELSRADEVDTVYDFVVSEFQNQRDDTAGGLVVSFSQLARVFCHHPKREGQFSTGYLERNILPAIVASGRAKMLPGKSRRSRKWVFYETVKRAVNVKPAPSS